MLDQLFKTLAELHGAKRFSAKSEKLFSAPSIFSLFFSEEMPKWNLLYAGSNIYSLNKMFAIVQAQTNDSEKNWNKQSFLWRNLFMWAFLFEEIGICTACLSNMHKR